MPQYIDVHALNLGELETEVLRKLWVETTEDSNGFSPDSAFVKYSQYRVRKKINKNYAELVALTRALQSWFIITLTANYTQYPVPPNCFDISDVFYFSSATTYTKLDVSDEGIIEDELSSGWRTAASTPQYAYVADRNKMVVKLGVAPAPSTSGTAPTYASGVYTKDRPYGGGDAVSGSAGGGSAALVYVDAHGQNFNSLGLVVGLTVLNLTDGSKGVIASITTTSSDYDTLTLTSLTGGSTNTFTPGDEIRVLGGEYGGLVTITATDAQYILSATVGHLPMPGITMAAGNLLVRGYMLPMLLRDRHQYPELNPMFHYAIALGAAADLGSEEPVDSPEYAQAQGYKQEFANAKTELGMFSATQYKSNFQMWSRNK